MLFLYDQNSQNNKDNQNLKMGQHNSVLEISPIITYQGQLQHNQPHGNGSLSIKKQDTMQWVIDGWFQNGQLIKCKAKNNLTNIEYSGAVKNGQLTDRSGSAKLEWQSKDAKATAQGIIEDGIILQGKIQKHGKYLCQGQYDQSAEFEEEEQKQNMWKIEQSYKKHKKYLQLNGANGKFCWIQPKQQVQGQFKNGDINGKGTYTFPDGQTYHGQFKNGYFYGQGTYNCQSPNFSPLKSLSGLFSKSQAHTSKSSSSSELHHLQFHNGDKYIGRMRNNKMHGEDGVYTYKSGRKYKGSFYCNSMTGNCQIQYEKNSILSTYKGEISEGLYNGLGVLQYRNGVIFKGYFLKGVQNGPSIYIYGTRMWKCLYILGELTDQFQQIISNQ